MMENLLFYSGIWSEFGGTKQGPSSSTDGVRSGQWWVGAQEVLVPVRCGAPPCRVPMPDADAPSSSCCVCLTACRLLLLCACGREGAFRFAFLGSSPGKKHFGVLVVDKGLMLPLLMLY
jgi:hypothetical protein